jgi:3-deoxy-D-manno-octulosonic-acid transferase
LEPAVFGLPVIFGPVYEKFVDAVRLKEQGFGFPVDNLNELKDALLQFIMDDTLLRSKQRALKQYIAGQAGATRMILEAIQQRFIR